MTKEIVFIVSISVDILYRSIIGTNFSKGDYMHSTEELNSLNSDDSISKLSKQKILNYTGRKRITKKLLDELIGKDVSLFEEDPQERIFTRNPNRFRRE